MHQTLSKLTHISSSSIRSLQLKTLFMHKTELRALLTPPSLVHPPPCCSSRLADFFPLFFFFFFLCLSLYFVSPVLSLQHIYSFFTPPSFPLDCFHFRCRQNPHLSPHSFFPNFLLSLPPLCKYLPPLLRVTHTAFGHITLTHTHRAVPCLPGQCCKPSEQMGLLTEWLSCSLTNRLSVQCCSDEGMMSFAQSLILIWTPTDQSRNWQPVQKPGNSRQTTKRCFDTESVWIFPRWQGFDLWMKIFHFVLEWGVHLCGAILCQKICQMSKYCWRVHYSLFLIFGSFSSSNIYRHWLIDGCTSSR